MRGAAILTGVQNGVGSLEAELHIVRVQNGHTRAVGESFAAQHFNVSVGNQRHQGTAKGRCRNGTNSMRSAAFHDWMPHQKGSKVAGHADGAHAGPTASVGNGKGLVQI